MINFGEVPAGSVLPIFFGSYNSAGASVALTGLAVTDIEVYKGTSMTQRASDAGYTLLDTDGIDLDGVTGINGFSIDTGDNTDAGFYTVGSFFTVVVSAVTIDTQTVNFVAATFRLKAAESIAGKPKVDVDAWLGTAAATPSVAGVPEVDLTHIQGSAVATGTAQLGVNVANAGGTLWNAGAITASTFAAGAINAAAIATNAIDADAIAADAITEIQAGLATAAALATVDDFLDTEIAAILQDTGTDIPAQIAALNNLSAAQVNAEIVDALTVDTYPEPGQTNPPATASLKDKIGYTYKAWRNRKDQTATTHRLFADDGITVDQKSTVSNDGTTAVRGEMVTGP